MNLITVQEKSSEVFLESRGYRVGTPCRPAERNLFMQKIIYHRLLKADCYLRGKSRRGKGINEDNKRHSLRTFETISETFESIGR